MKKGKTNTLRRIKRQKFPLILIRKTIASLLICTLLCLIYSSFIMKDILTERTAMAADSVADITKDLSEYFADFADSETEVDKNYLKWSCVLNSETGCMVSAIYDLTSGELIADSSRATFLIVRDRDTEPHASKSKIYICSYDELELWKTADSTLAVKPSIANISKVYDIETWVNSETDYYYLKEDGTFLPGKGTLYYTEDDYDEGYDSEDILIQTFDYTPTDLSSYEKVVKDGDDFAVLGPVTIGYDDSLAETLYGFPFYPTKDSKMAFDRMLADLEETGEIPYVEYSSQTMFTYYNAKTHTLIAPNGHEYAILSASCFDLFEEFGFLLWPVIGIAYAIALVLAFFIARISYAKLNAQYRMEDYRKTLMNTMAHDLKSPLMSISGYAENLQMNPEHPKRDSYLQGIQSGISYMNRTIEDILSLSKLEERSGKINYTQVNLHEILSSLIEKNEAFAADRNLSVKVTGEAIVSGEATLVNELLDNLLTNALIYAPKGSEITITLSNEKMTFSNPCETDLTSCIDRLCEPFVTGDKDRSDQKGSGLGLAIARNIAELLSYKLLVSYADKTFEATLLFKNKKRLL